LAVHRNLLEAGQGLSGTILESVNQWFLSSLQQFLFLHSLTAWEMETAIAHQRNALEIRKPLQVLI
jgi:hypothetical protein